MASADRLLPEWTDMQGLIVSPYTHLNHAEYSLWRIVDVAGAKAWLRKRLRDRDVTPAERKVHGNYGDLNINIALTHDGLRTLSGNGQRLDGFARPFVEGIHRTDHRRRILGDVGDNDSSSWSWGGKKTKEVHLLLMAFGRDARDLDAMPTPAPAMELAWRLRALPYCETGGREHFGFMDGLSQPILKGTAEAERLPESRHLTAFGEVVLGYPNADGNTPKVPTLPGLSTFGKNGSYLVLRQLEQDYAQFWGFVGRKTDNDPHLAKQLAAKIIGRHLDGTPLVANASHTDNEFGFAEDPFGYGCPVGAHIRRANPRDSFGNNNDPADDAIKGNRHRILRRGRSYGPKWDEKNPDTQKEERGLMFLCLNSDIQRQFEFIQQNWINNREFAGVAGECDPLIGDRSIAGNSQCRFTVAALPAPLRVVGLPTFVTVRGGGYFFLPGLKAFEALT